MKEILSNIIAKSNNRFDLSSGFINENNLKHIAELGVYRGDFAKHILEKCNDISTYTMIDPWRNLSDWNKPANKNNEIFENYYKETLLKTEFAKEKRKLLRGKTTEVIDQIENEAYDFVYIDGDHTLKGITIDLINIWPKVKNNGFIIGDDFSSSIWQHNLKYEPTMIFPFAVYFAEAVNARILGVPFNQFIIIKDQSDFEFIDLTDGKYLNLDMRHQFVNNSSGRLKSFIKKNINRIIQI